MPGIYARWMDRWERRLASRDTNRMMRPFEWGLEWLRDVPGCPGPPNGDNTAWLDRFTEAAMADSPAFFSYTTPSDYELDGDHLFFTSPAACPYPENNRVHADFFPAGRPAGRRRAVLVLPQWNAGADGHAGLCRLLNRFGISALRMSLAYHDRRMPPSLSRADYHVSSNIGRTIHAGRQSVLDARACLDWLSARGFERLGILGTSLGSCIAFITAAHDTRISAAVYNHVSMHFGDVVWTGLSTAHIRQSLEGSISRDELRRHWSLISPASFFPRMEGRSHTSLLIWARYDSTFLPAFSQQAMATFRSRNIPHRVVALPCGHYTTGRFPFNIMDGLAMCAFLSRHL